MLPIALIAVALSGFISLSYEILWFRVFAYITGGTATSFAVVLAVFLLGIAVGSFAARAFCRDSGATGDRRRLALPAILMVVASVLGYALIPTVAAVVQVANYAWSLIGVLLTAAAFGAV